jgi:hypothetical protein
LAATGWRLRRSQDALNPRELAGRYFSDELIDTKLVLRVLPIPLTAATMTMLIPTAIRPYSMAVAPDSSLKNFEISNIA